MVRIGEIEVQFLIEGEVAAEHPDADSGEKPKDTATRYIEATPGLTFGIRLTVHKDYTFSPAISYLDFKVYIDGRSSCGKIVSKSEFQNIMLTKEFLPMASAGLRGEKVQTIAFGNLDTLGEFG